MIGKDADEIIEEIVQSLLYTYQKGWKQSMRGISSSFCNADRLFYKYFKIRLNYG